MSVPAAAMGAVREWRVRVAADNAAQVYLNGALIDDDPAFATTNGHDAEYWNREIAPVAFLPGLNVLAGTSA